MVNAMEDTKKRWANRTFRFLKSVYLKLFRINDSPQRIAAGLGIGVFFGVLPGLGPVAAILSAILVRVNRAAALIGSIITNTWLSIPVFALAVSIGSAVTGTSYANISRDWAELTRNFHLSIFLKASAINIALPVLTGYMIVSIAIGLAAYMTALLILRVIGKRKTRL